MATAPKVSDDRGWWVRFATTDFCPWANRFVYWLKEPVGWFVLATGISCAIGLYFSPLGWTLAASLVSLMVIGMIWPWIAVRSVRIELAPTPDSSATHEDSDARMVVSVVNRLPLPLWGMTVEGYLETPATDPLVDDGPKVATVGLASVPPACKADYFITIHPSLRGLYPQETPSIACSFPFGIWTARKPMSESSPLMVWPKVFPMSAAMKFQGDLKTETDEGGHPAPTGEFIGVRDYRRGDSLKYVNWIASAKTDSLIVTERGAAQTALIRFSIDTSLASGGVDELSRRVRVAASIVTSLWNQKIPVHFHLDGRLLRTNHTYQSYQRIMDALASIPILGTSHSTPAGPSRTAAIWVGGDDHGSTAIQIHQPASGQQRSSGGTTKHSVVTSEDDLATAMQRFWQEAESVKVSA